MKDSIFRSSFRALCVAFCVIIGLFLGIIAIFIALGGLSTDSERTKLNTVNTEEILPNAEGKRTLESSEAPVILQLNIEGVIGTELLNTKTVRQILVESREGDFKNNQVKGILLNINSPGGTVIDADGIFHDLLDYKKKYNTPIYAYTNGLCASGGMYVALAADKIFSSDVSLIGSIGVLLPTFMNFTKLLEKIGVDTLTITAGKEKDALNPLRPWKPGEDDNYRLINEYYYEKFVDIVTTYRPKIDKNKLVQDYGAKIFPAAIAQEYGYIDVSGVTISETLKALVEHLEIADKKYQVVTLENKNWWKNLFSSQSSLLTGKVKHEITFSPEIDVMLKNQFLYLYCPQ